MKITQTMNRLGWAVAAALVGGIALLGFQNTEVKFGVVDLNKCIQQSQLGQMNTAQLNSAVNARRGIVDFVKTYKVLTPEQAKKIVDLTLKTTPTEADKSELEKTKQAVMAAAKRRDELAQKGSGLTDAERTELEDFARRASGMAGVLDQWNADFTEDLSALQQKLQQETIDKARAAAAQVGKAQSFTVIFEGNIAVYAANDMTEAVIKQMNANK